MEDIIIGLTKVNFVETEYWSPLQTLGPLFTAIVQLSEHYGIDEPLSRVFTSPDKHEMLTASIMNELVERIALLADKVGQEFHHKQFVTMQTFNPNTFHPMVDATVDIINATPNYKAVVSEL